MTRQEFYEKYGDVLVTFSSYWKYSFGFSAALPDGSAISVSVGGHADDIYRFEVTAGLPVRVADLEPYGGCVRKDGKEICSFYDY